MKTCLRLLLEEGPESRVAKERKRDGVAFSMRYSMAWGEKTQIKAAGTWGWLPGQSAEGAVGWIRRAIAASRVKWNLHRKVVASI